MRASCGCPIEDGMTLHGYDGPCMDEVTARQWGPTDDDLCAGGGHAYYGDDAGRGRCYCGAQEYPPGGPPLGPCEPGMTDEEPF